LSDVILTILALIVLLGTLVFFHELGHFSIAKLLRIRVEEFAFGFGPKWIRLFKRGDTEYTIHPVPLGGFVKLAGMEPEEEVPDGFNSKPVGYRVLTYLAGPVMSFVLAYLIFSVMGFTVGLPITGEALNRVELVERRSIAEKAGLRTGDVIVAINSKRIDSGEEMISTIHGSMNKPLDIVLKRDGKFVTIHATPEPRDLDGKTVGVLGFMATPKLQRVGLIDSVKYGSRTTTFFIAGILHVLVSSELKEAVGGPLAIVDATRIGVKRGANGFLQLMAVLSLSLGIINLLPIPILDGGQMLLLIVERIKGRRLSPHTLEVAQRIGLTVIAIIFLMIMYLDLQRVYTRQFFR